MAYGSRPRLKLEQRPRIAVELLVMLANDLGVARLRRDPLLVGEMLLENSANQLGAAGLLLLAQDIDPAKRGRVY